MLLNAYFWLRSSHFKIFSIYRETNLSIYCKKLPWNSTKTFKNNSKEDFVNFSTLILFRVYNTSYKEDLLSIIDIKFTAYQH